MTLIAALSMLVGILMVAIGIKLHNNRLLKFIIKEIKKLWDKKI